MSAILEKAILVLLIVAAAICAWSVLTPNHLFVG
ncbi:MULTISPECIES: hypothetical protein [unclassified Campylobacter]|nr:MULTISPECIES: hypothetical protein [unclassified Campylobacter]